VLWCFVLNPHRRPRDPNLLQCNTKKATDKLRDVIRQKAWSFFRTSSGVRLCWELEKPEGSKGGPKISPPGWTNTSYEPRCISQLSPHCRGYSKLRTHTAPRKVLCSQIWTYRRALGRCVSILSSIPCTGRAALCKQFLVLASWYRGTSLLLKRNFYEPTVGLCLES
jgi:hypothetical protein